MGCLKFAIKVIIVVLAIIGFKFLGGFDFIKNLHLFEKPTQEVLLEKSKDIADFSSIPDEYELDKTANLLGYKAVIAEHKASGQKLAVVNPKDKVLLTKKDFSDGSVKTKITDLNKKLSYNYIRLEDVKLTKQGKFKTMGQTVPYIKFEADVKNLPIKRIEGIVGVAEIKLKDENGKEIKDKTETKILLAASESGKYSQILTEQFFKKVK